MFLGFLELSLALLLILGLLFKPEDYTEVSNSVQVDTTNTSHTK